MKMNRKENADAAPGSLRGQLSGVVKSDFSLSEKFLLLANDSICQNSFGVFIRLESSSGEKSVFFCA